MFDIKKLSLITTLKSSNYSVTYDKEKEDIVTFKTRGKMSEDDKDVFTYVFSNKQRFTTPFTIKNKDFSSIRSFFLSEHGITDIIFKSRKDYMSFLVDNNLFEEWIERFAKEFANNSRRYIEEHDLDEESSDDSLYERIEDELSIFMNSGYDNLLKESKVYIIDDISDSAPFVFSFIKEDSVVTLKINFSDSAIALKDILEAGDISFIDPIVLNTITTWASFKIDTNKELLYEPNSINNTVKFTYNSRGKSIHDFIPQSLSWKILSLLKSLNNIIEDDDAITIIEDNSNESFINLSDSYDESEKVLEEPGSLELFMGLMIYNFNSYYLDDIDKKIKNKVKNKYELQLDTEFDEKDDFNLIVRIKNLTTNEIKELTLDIYNTYNSLELFSPKLIKYFNEYGKPKEFIVETFFDYIFIANALDMWDAKVSYKRLNIKEEETGEADDDYIKA